MNFINKNAKNFTVAWVHLKQNSKSSYANTGSRQQIQWLYLLSGYLKIEYSLNGYVGCYEVSTNVLADLRPVKDLNITVSSGDTDCYAIAFMSAEPSVYEAEIISANNQITPLISNKEKIIVPLAPGITINSRAVPQFTVARLKSNTAIQLTAISPESLVFMFEKNE